jgi:Zn finger protein HypA/HybF involved in hydrogenase expression
MVMIIEGVPARCERCIWTGSINVTVDGWCEPCPQCDHPFLMVRSDENREFRVSNFARRRDPMRSGAW